MKNHYAVLDIDPSADAQQIKRAYYGLVRQYPPERFPREFKEIREAYDTLSDEKKRSAYDEAGDMPEQAIFPFNQAKIMMERGFPDQAAETLGNLLKYYPNVPLIRIEYARALELQGKTGIAIRIWEELVQQSPGDASFTLALANAYHRRGWRKKALDMFRRLTVIDGSDADHWIPMVVLHANADEFSEAGEVCLDAIEATRKHGNESTRLYAYAIVFSTDADPFYMEERFKDILRLIHEGKSDFGQNADNILSLLLAFMESRGAMHLFPYIREIVATLPFVDEALRERLSKAERFCEILELENNGFSDLFHDLFITLLDGCDCGECRREILLAEFAILNERDAFRTELIRLHKEYPQLYALHADFFNEALRTRNLEKMIMQRVKVMAKNGYMPSHSSHASYAAYDDEEYDEEEAFVIQETVRREGPKIGRNDPCPCGSGKKYKKCCLQNAAAS